MRIDARFIAVIASTLVLAKAVMACEWDGGTTKIIPGVLELHRGCCDNDRNYLLVAGPLKINLHKPIHMGVFVVVVGVAICMGVRFVRSDKRREEICQQTSDGDSSTHAARVSEPPEK